MKPSLLGGVSVTVGPTQGKYNTRLLNSLGAFVVTSVVPVPALHLLFQNMSVPLLPSFRRQQRLLDL